jgi:hypothetical protein
MRADSSCAVVRISSMIRCPSARALSRIWAASVRASDSCWRYSVSSRCASACASSARLMPPSIASRRAWNVASIRGQAYFIST